MMRQICKAWTGEIGADSKSERDRCLLHFHLSGRKRRSKGNPWKSGNLGIVDAVVLQGRARHIHGHPRRTCLDVHGCDAAADGLPTLVFIGNEQSVKHVSLFYEADNASSLHFLVPKFCIKESTRAPLLAPFFSSRFVTS